MLQSETRINEALADGVTRAWPFTFKVFAASHLRLQVRDDDESDWTEVSSADFTVTLVADTTEPGAFSGGTVTYPKSPAAVLEAPAELRILREVPYTQTEIRLRNTSGWNPLSVEQEFDRIAMRHQQLRDELLVFAGEIVVVVGPQGEEGEQGEDGPQGDRGDTGRPNLFLGTVDDLEDLPELGEDGNNYLYDNAGTMEIWSWITSEWVLTGELPAGATGATGADGEDGVDGAGIAIAGTVANYAALPGGLTGGDAGDAYFVETDGLLYIWDGAAFPADGSGIEFRGPTGEPGTPGTDAYIPNAETFNEVGDARYTRRANNLSDLTNVATARTNLVVAQKQSTTSDTTSGRGMIVGAFGIGNDGISIPSDNANLATYGGFYACTNSTTNLPSWATTPSGSSLQVVAWNNTNLQQTLYYRGSDANNIRVAFRQCRAGTFGVWIEVAKTASFQVSADPTGTVSASAAINAAITAANTAGGGRVVIPRGTYKLTTTIAMLSDVHVECEPGVEFELSEADTTIVVRFGTAGSFIGSGVAFAADRTRGQRGIVTAAVHGCAAGDLVRLIGQRNALSADAGAFQLSTGTGGLPTCHFQEFAFVRNVLSTTSLELDRAIFFPDYNSHDDDETSETALAASLLIKVTPCRDASWSGGTFLSGDSPVTNLFQFASSYKCRVAGVTDLRGDRLGASFLAVVSFQCVFEKCVSIVAEDLTFDYDTHHNTLTPFRITGAQECRISDCDIVRGAQCIDFTYSATYKFCTYRCVVENCRVDGAMEQAFTSHPGVYGSVIRGNDFTSCTAAGLLLRGLAERVEDNRIRGQIWTFPDPDVAPRHAGIQLTQGHTRDTVIRGNLIEGFHYGVLILDTAAEYTRMGNTIQSNTFNYIERGVYVELGSNDANDVRGLVIDGNSFSHMGTRCIDICDYMAGVAVTNNVFHGPYERLAGAAAARFAVFNANCPGFYVVNNLVYDYDQNTEAPDRTIFSVVGVTDTTAFPAATWEFRGRCFGNQALPTALNFIITETAYVQVAPGDQGA